MPRSIAEIKKEIELKTKMSSKNKIEIGKLDTTLLELTSEEAEYQKELKTKKDEKTFVKLQDGLKKAQLGLKSAKLKHTTLVEAENKTQESLKTLIKELETAEEGVEKYGNIRKQGIAMLEREGKKLLDQCELARSGAEDAELCSQQAEAAAGKGDDDGAQGARNNANNAVMKTIQAARAAKELIKDIKSEMTTTQRNLKAKTFDLVDSDVLVHGNLTKQVQDKFKILELKAEECEDFVKRAELAAAEATEFANATSIGIEMYESMLTKALLAGQVQVKAIRDVMSAKWGGYITNKGELFTRIIEQLEQKPKDPGIRSGADKAVEQGQTYLDTTKTKVDSMIKTLTDSCNKATKRVPTQYKATLKPQIDKLNMLAIQMLNFQKQVQSNFDATMIEFQKLVTKLS